MPSAANLKPINIDKASSAQSSSQTEPEMKENGEMSQDNNDKQKSQNLTSLQQVGMQYLVILEHKIRNLEKRKNKLESYQQLEESGKSLTTEQKKAMEKFDEVAKGLELSKDYYKQFQAISTSANKDAKREAKKAFFVRQQQETAKVREVLILQDIIARFADLNVCKDFSDGVNGACKLDEKDLKFMEKFPKYVQPKRPAYSNETSFGSSAKTAAEHLSNVIDARQRPFLDSGYTYEQIKELFDKILSSGYFDKDIEIVPDSSPVESETMAENAQENNTGAENHVETSESGTVVRNAPEMVEDVKPKVEAPAATQVPAPAFPVQSNQAPSQQTQQPTTIPVQVPIAAVQQIPHGMQGIPSIPSNAPSTTVRAVENAYYKHHQYISQQQPTSQQQPLAPQSQPIHEVIGSANFFFLQDSEIENDTIVNASSALTQQPLNKQSQLQQQAQSSNIPSNISTQTFTGQNYYQQHPQQQAVTVTSQANTTTQVSAQATSQLYAPPGLKLKPQSHIPNYPNNSQANQNPPQMLPQQQAPQQQLQQAPTSTTQGIPPQSISQGIGSGTNQQIQSHQPQRTYPPSSHFPPVQHYQHNSIQQSQHSTGPHQINQISMQQQKLVESDLKMESTNLVKSTSASPVIDNSTNNAKREWNPSPHQAPQHQKPTPIDTWTNETANSLNTSQNSTNNTSSSYNNRPVSGGYNRNNRTQPSNLSGRSGSMGGNAGLSKYGQAPNSGYRNNNSTIPSQQQSAARNNIYQNGNGGSGDRLTSSSPGERGGQQNQVPSHGSGDTFYRNNSQNNDRSMGGSRYDQQPRSSNGGYVGANKPRNMDNSSYVRGSGGPPMNRYNNGNNYHGKNTGPSSNPLVSAGQQRK